ncbi:MAG: hypothetical protein KKE11_06480 [Gammaproteobacteria bacterium]|nr:hypothetical protein [Gammaproteobacteria bacterium]
MSLRAYEVSVAIQEYIINQGISRLLRRYVSRNDSKKLQISAASLYFKQTTELLYSFYNI